jgi:hypothetical protein
MDTVDSLLEKFLTAIKACIAAAEPLHAFIRSHPDALSDCFDKRRTPESLRIRIQAAVDGNIGLDGKLAEGNPALRCRRFLFVQGAFEDYIRDNPSEFISWARTLPSNDQASLLTKLPNDVLGKLIMEDYRKSDDIVENENNVKANDEDEADVDNKDEDAVTSGTEAKAEADNKDKTQIRSEHNAKPAEEDKSEADEKIKAKVDNKEEEVVKSVAEDKAEAKIGNTAYDEVWIAIFGATSLSNYRTNAKLVVFGIDLEMSKDIAKDTRKRPHWVLVFSDPDNDFGSDIGVLSKFEKPGTYHLDHIDLTVGCINVSEVKEKDFGYLFHPDGPLQTQYCFWNDREKKIRVSQLEEIIGIDGRITQPKDLEPIFSIQLQLPEDHNVDDTEWTMDSFLFRNYGGPSAIESTIPIPLVDFVRSQPHDVYTNFKFKDSSYETYRGKNTDWDEIAEREVGRPCKVITLPDMDFGI